ncbi:MAG: uracil-DNA glycosylase [Hyphomicrobiaceae bacterium]
MPPASGARRVARYASAAMEDAEQREKLLGLLAWWREAGVADALDDEPIDWTSRADAKPGGDFAWPDAEGASSPSPPIARRGPSMSSQPPETSRRSGTPREPGSDSPGHARGTPPSVPPTASRPMPPRRDFETIASARDAARSARTLAELEQHLRAFDGCPLKATAKTTCFYRGHPVARVMIIGEAPGRDEDIAGKPFVGRAGQLLDRMLAAIALSEADVHVTNIVYWRPPGNRTPTPEEAQICRPFLERQIELVEPEFILTLGGPAAKAMLATPDGILKLRGRWRDVTIAGRSIRLMPTLHPAYLLRQPEAKRQAWRDLLQLKTALDGEPEGNPR